MLLRKLTLSNVGLFQGRHEFEFLPKHRKNVSRNITLIGGMNGAGKTTILDSLRLCLYGKDFLGSRVSQKKYDKYLERLIHRSKKKSEQSKSEANIQIEFEHSYLGTTDSYQVNRNWYKNGAGIIEQLTVEKNGKPLSDLVPEQWQAFLKDLIPPGLSGLFFFDGEKIQNLADEVQGSEELADSIRALLGLDLAKRLSQDLKIYINKQAISKPDSEHALQIKQIKKEKALLEKEKQALEQTRDRVGSSKGLVEGKIEAKDRELKASGGEFATSRSNLVAEEKHLADLQQKQEEYIRNMCMENLPFTLAPELCEELLGQLEREAELTQKQNAAKEFKAMSRKVNKDLTPDLRSAGIDDKSRKQVVTIFKKWIEEKAFKYGNTEDDLIHDFSSKEKQEIETVLSNAASRVPEEMKQAARELRNTSNRRITVQAAITKAPADDVLGPMWDDLNLLNQKLGKYNQQIQAKESELRDFDNKISECNRRLDKLFEKEATKGKSATKASLAVKVIDAMDEYVKKVTVRKIEQLNSAVLERYSRLSRKTDAVKSISIDPTTFRVTLLDADGNKIEMKELSAGEKQILAVSILWALAATSGRLLPVVIDTPLGRLDSSHRDNLVSNYFPEASHQVILLSTDTEVDKSLYKKLAPRIANIYHLDYDKATRRTKSSRGYFWDIGVKS